MANAKITSETEVSSSELACVLGITGRNIRQLVEDGQLKKKDGRVLLCDSVKRYVAFKSRKEADDEEKRLEKARRTADVTMKASKAQIAKMEADELRGKMHRSEDVAAMTDLHRSRLAYGFTWAVGCRRGCCGHARRGR